MRSVRPYAAALERRQREPVECLHSGRSLRPSFWGLCGRCRGHASVGVLHASRCCRGRESCGVARRAAESRCRRPSGAWRVQRARAARIAAQLARAAGRRSRRAMRGAAWRTFTRRRAAQPISWSLGSRARSTFESCSRPSYSTPWVDLGSVDGLGPTLRQSTVHLEAISGRSKVGVSLAVKYRPRNAPALSLDVWHPGRSSSPDRPCTHPTEPEIGPRRTPDRPQGDPRSTQIDFRGSPNSRKHRLRRPSGPQRSHGLRRSQERRRSVGRRRGCSEAAARLLRGCGEAAVTPWAAATRCSAPILWAAAILWASAMPHWAQFPLAVATRGRWRSPVAQRRVRRICRSV